MYDKIHMLCNIHFWRIIPLANHTQYMSSIHQIYNISLCDCRFDYWCVQRIISWLYLTYLLSKCSASIRTIAQCSLSAICRLKKLNIHNHYRRVIRLHYLHMAEAINFLGGLPLMTLAINFNFLFIFQSLTFSAYSEL